VDRSNRDRRRFKVAAVIGVAFISFLASIAIIWWLPLEFPWSTIVSWVVAAGIGWWGARFLIRIDGVGRHRED